MAEARKVVGWFYRNGRRIPIFEKSEGALKKHAQTTARTKAETERHIVNDVFEHTKSPNGVISPEAVDYTVKKNVELIGKNRAQIRENVRDRALKGRDVEEGTYQGKPVTVGSEVDMPGGKGTVQRIYETGNADL